jgi:hypothetical protein
MLKIGYTDTYQYINGVVRILPNITLLLSTKLNVLPKNVAHNLEKVIQKVNSTLIFKKVELFKEIAVDFNNEFGI